jgi:DNA-binding MarR family transcriptional regulator
MKRARPDVLDAIASLQRLAELFAERRRQLAREADLTETQWRVLEEAEGEDFMPSMFARRRACSPAAVSRTLRQLLDRGLVSASIGASDGRQRVYRLTAKGRRRLAELRENRARAIEAVWEDLPPEQLQAFTRFACDLAERLEAYLGSGRPGSS